MSLFRFTNFVWNMTQLSYKKLNYLNTKMIVILDTSINYSDRA